MQTECWEWNGDRDVYGYGRRHLDGKQWKTHRLAWAWVNWDGEGDWKEPPEGKQVLHHCDNPPCVNPKHLYLGTPADNMKDKANRGRSTAGEKHPMSKLTISQVRWIRSAEGTYVEIGKEFGVHRTQIGKIKRGDRWKGIE